MFLSLYLFWFTGRRYQWRHQQAIRWNISELVVLFGYNIKYLESLFSWKSDRYWWRSCRMNKYACDIRTLCNYTLCCTTKNSSRWYLGRGVNRPLSSTDWSAWIVMGSKVQYVNRSYDLILMVQPLVLCIHSYIDPIIYHVTWQNVT